MIYLRMNDDTTDPLLNECSISFNPESGISYNIPTSELWYTSTTGQAIDFNLSGFKSNTYTQGKGILKFDDALDTIGPDTFVDIPELVSLKLPGSVVNLGNGAIRNCENLKKVILPESITDYNGLFVGCGFKRVTIGKNVENLGTAYSENSGLRRILVESGNSVYNSENNCNAVIETKTHKLILGCKNTTIQVGVEEIGENAFKGATGLTTINLPGSIEKIYDGAFSGTSLKVVNCRAWVKPELGEDVFPEDTVIYVLGSIYSTYKNDENWNKYELRILV